MMDRSSLRVIADKNCPRRVFNIVSADRGEIFTKTHFGNLILMNISRDQIAISQYELMNGWLC